MEQEFNVVSFRLSFAFSATGIMFNGGVKRVIKGLKIYCFNRIRSSFMSIFIHE